MSGNGSQLSLVGERPDIQARMAVAPAGTSFEMSDADGFTTSIGNGLQAAKGKQPKQTTAASISPLRQRTQAAGSTPKHFVGQASACLLLNFLSVQRIQNKTGGHNLYQSPSRENSASKSSAVLK